MYQIYQNVIDLGGHQRSITKSVVVGRNELFWTVLAAIGAAIALIVDTSVAIGFWDSPAVGFCMLFGFPLVLFVVVGDGFAIAILCQI